MHLLRLLYLLLFFSLPFTVESFALGPGLNIPSEPLQIIIAFILLLNFKRVWTVIKNNISHPLFLSIAVFIFWQWVSCMYSYNTVISTKYTIIATLHFIVFFVGFIYTQNSKPELLQECIIAYTLGLLPIILRGMYLHAEYGFVIDFSAASMRPYYKDHPLYGTALNLLIPVWAYFRFKSNFKYPLLNNRWLTGTVLIILTGAMFLSFSRAALLTCITGATICALIYRYKANTKKLALLLLSISVFSMGLIIAIANYAQKKEFVKNTTIYNQLISSLNWKYDVANLERLNRYKCAWRMFKERPITGFGNNMYKFKYLAYQNKSDMTRISLNHLNNNARAGTGGNSHSDYLAALTELGLVGFILWVLIVLLSLGIPVAVFLKSGQTLYLFIFYSLLTLFLHSLVNNFIHEDKIESIALILSAFLVLPAVRSSKTKVAS